MKYRLVGFPRGARAKSQLFWIPSFYKTVQTTNTYCHNHQTHILSLFRPIPYGPIFSTSIIIPFLQLALNLFFLYSSRVYLVRWHNNNKWNSPYILWLVQNLEIITHTKKTKNSSLLVSQRKIHTNSCTIFLPF